MSGTGERRFLTREEAETLTNKIKEGFAHAHRLAAMHGLNPYATPTPEKGEDRRSVYFIQADNGLIKIGVAAKPKERMQTLRTMSPVPLRLVLVLPGLGAAGERQLHKRFAGYRDHGEWFVNTPELVAFIREKRDEQRSPQRQ